MDIEVQQFEDFLRSKGLKNTRGRKIILREIKTRKDHFNAEKLYFSLTRKGTRVSRPTIYRTLKLLERFRLIEMFDIKKNCFYYEPISQKKNHGHLICEQCGKIIDFSSNGVELLKSEMINIINHVIDNTGKGKFHAILGGTHLDFLTPEQLEESIVALNKLEVEKIGVSHCTGLRASFRLHLKFGDRFFYGRVGSVLEI